MDRRDYLRATAGAASAFTLAGCLGFGSDGTSRPDVLVDPSNYQEEPVDDGVQKTTDALVTVQEKVHEALTLMEEIVEEFGGITDRGELPINTTPISDHLTTIDQLLDTAAENATERQQRFIDGMEKITTAFEATVSVLTDLSDALEQYVEWAITVYSGAIADIQDAYDRYVEHTNAAVARLSDVKGPFSSIDKDVYRTAEWITEGRLNRFVTEIDAVVSVTSAVQPGMATVSETVPVLDTAQNQIENDDYDASKQSLRTAATSFADATEQFTTASENVARHYQSDIAGLTCATDTANTATTAYADAITAKQAGDEETRINTVMEAEQTLDGCTYDLLKQRLVPIRSALL